MVLIKKMLSNLAWSNIFFFSNLFIVVQQILILFDEQVNNFNMLIQICLLVRKQHFICMVLFISVQTAMCARLF